MGSVSMPFQSSLLLSVLKSIRYVLNRFRYLVIVFSKSSRAFFFVPETSLSYLLTFNIFAFNHEI